MNNEFKYMCMLFKTDGYLCRHIWVVMKHLNIRVIQRSLILPRWHKDAKTALSNINTHQANNN